MKIYLAVEEDEEGGYNILGAFSTFEKADEFEKAIEEGNEILELELDNDKLIFEVKCYLSYSDHQLKKRYYSKFYHQKFDRELDTVKVLIHNAGYDVYVEASSLQEATVKGMKLIEEFVEKQ